MLNMTTETFTYKITRISDKLNNYALSLTRNTEDAKDLVQETLTKAFVNNHRFDEQTNLNAWCYTIMRNTFINTYRKNESARNYVAATTADFPSAKDNFRRYNPDNIYNANEITKVIDLLSIEYKKPFKMYTSGYKYKEIAEQMNLPIGTIKSRIFLARKQLMETLKDYN